MLAGARETIRKYKPYVIFEIGLYIIEEYDITFEQYFSFFSSLNYTLCNNKNGKKITLENLYMQIPERYTTDIIAMPVKTNMFETH